MTVSSDTYMPKSKTPKMDDLDYSKWDQYIALLARWLANWVAK